ncbi:MAG: peptidoglycan DD-metalloendopeptidase family protein [Aquabacterium sp.]|uniref:peptidoglycan DD-metalloendopeptidase family protein n=1 Tax=Aquabacterium sp. TaxID=1872578 RepID=UPI002A36339A|nr:peptidoglycan DD-metalloendopeptidase family protein [Aquabacterium sp.]MDX9844934.1 peptidoglycan DD-metalloendopeptidase family protein [Aquabacterium sp.]
MRYITPSFRLTAAVALVAALAGCASPTHRAPVEERVSAAQPQRLPPGAENAGKPGYYTIKPGDTLIRIGLETGQSWRDIAGWNNIENANRIEVGQVIRIVPPVGEAAAATAASAGAGGMAAAKPVTTARIEPRAVDAKSAASAPSSPASSASAPEPKSDVKSGDEPAWIWPANGPTIAQFEEGKRKGLVIGGKAGDPVVAAGDGRVVYAGSGLRGYGNLIIIKHGGDYLTAYAHNQALLVKEDQAVRKGQKIAEMGATDADRVQLHFEIRKQGKPIDPARQLPAR